MEKYPWNNDFESTSWQPNQNKLGNLFMCLDLIKDMIEKHDSFNMLSKTMTIDISTYLRYSNNCCFKNNIERQFGSHLCRIVVCQRRLQSLLIGYIHNWLEKWNSQGKLVLNTFNRASILKPSSPNSSKQLCFQHRLNGQGMWYLHQSSSNSGDT